MRLLFDFSLASDDAAGPRTIMDGLLRGWAEAHPHDQVTVFGPSSLRSRLNGADFSLVQPRFDIPPRRILQQQVELPIRHLARTADVVIVPNLACSLFGLGRPIVGTLNDVRHLRRPEEFSRGSRSFRGLVWAASARRMAAVVSISHFSLNEADALGLRLPKLRAVAPCGVDHLPVDLDVREKQETVVCVAHRASKGLHELPAIWAGVRAALGISCPLLVVTGVAQGRHAVVDAQMAKAGVTAGYRLAPFLSSPAFYSALAEARAVLYLSTYEGFGLVPSEASALGTHCFVYDLAPYRERPKQLSITSVPAGDAVALSRELAEYLRRGHSRVPAVEPNRWADFADVYRTLALRAIELRR